MRLLEGESFHFIHCDICCFCLAREKVLLCQDVSSCFPRAGVSNLEFIVVVVVVVRFLVRCVQLIDTQTHTET